MSTNSAPYSPKFTVATAGMAAANARSRKKPRWSIGWAQKRSQPTKAATTASPPAPTASTEADAHPRDGPSMIAHSTSPMPAIDKTAPTRSGADAPGSRESGTSSAAAISPATAIGTLTRNTDPHQKCASSSPPMIGPSATPTPVVAAHRLIARCRSPGARYMSLMIDSDDGISSAPPIPMPARAAISTVTEPANAAQAEPTAKKARPAMNVRFRPTRSARLPAVSSSPAKTMT